jgi:hypothetical protein
MRVPLYFTVGVPESQIQILTLLTTAMREGVGRRFVVDGCNQSRTNYKVGVCVTLYTQSHALRIVPEYLCFGVLITSLVTSNRRLTYST